MSQIRSATKFDASDILEIYAPFCSPSAHEGFEITVPSVEESGRRLEVVLDSFPWLVYEEDGKVLGYAHGAAYQARAAFNWDVAVSIYFAPYARGRKLSARLYEELFSQLRALGFINAYATISLPNEAAIALHRGMSFESVGILPNAVNKGREWHDIAIYHLKLQEYVLNPELPRKNNELMSQKNQTVQNNK